MLKRPRATSISQRTLLLLPQPAHLLDGLLEELHIQLPVLLGVVLEGLDSLLNSCNGLVLGLWACGSRQLARVVSVTGVRAWLGLWCRSL